MVAINSHTKDRSALFFPFLTNDCHIKKMMPEEMCCIAMSIINKGKPILWDTDEATVNIFSIGENFDYSTTLIVVSIIASLGIRIPQLLMIPLDSHNAFELLTRINLNKAQLRTTVEKETGCFVDDRILSHRGENINNARIADNRVAIVIASIVSKMVLAGITHSLIDIRVNSNFKICNSREDGLTMLYHLKEVADYFGVKTQISLSFGQDMVSGCIGLSLEVQNALAVLQNTPYAPKSLRKKAIFVAIEIIKLVWNIDSELAKDLVTQKINSGESLTKLINICEAQGGFHKPPKAKFCKTIEATCCGIIDRINNKKISALAALVGVSDTYEAGVDVHVCSNEHVQVGQPLFSIHANLYNKLELAHEYYKKNKDTLIKMKE